MEDKLQKTLHREDSLRKLGVRITTIWECEWSRLKKENPDIGGFVKELDINQVLNPRGALYGGRVNATTLYKKCKGRERISYLDVCRYGYSHYFQSKMDNF